VSGSASAVVADGVGDEAEAAGDGFGGLFPPVPVDFGEVGYPPVGGLFAFVDPGEVVPQFVFEVGSPVSHVGEGSAGLVG
jgi:hypothetical protein